MAATTSLVSYGSDSEEEEIPDDLQEDDQDRPEDRVDITSLKSKFLLNSAPIVTAKVNTILLNIQLSYSSF